MSPQVQATFDAALSDIMAHVAKLNEITCDKHEITTNFLLSVMNDPMLDNELRLLAGQLMTMYTILHLTKHRCDDISKTRRPAQLLKIVATVVASMPPGTEPHDLRDETEVS